MVIQPVWFRFWGRDGSLEPAIRASLTRSGVVLTTAGASYGVVCFSEIGDEVFQLIRDAGRGPQGRVLAICADPVRFDRALSWRLLHAGASDVIGWYGADTARQVLARLERWTEIDRLTVSALERESLIGHSREWLGLARKVVEAAHFSDTPVLLTGESGTGKELIARLIHAVGNTGSNGGDLVTVDCSTIVPELSGSELFGHERGAFTGAHSLREGAFALADGATLFLDEIGELPLPLQAQMLRAIQEKTYKRVGGNTWLQTRFRLVCATNRDLEELVRSGQFRLDLYHRIAGWVFRTPRLDERREDILPLARHFLQSAIPEETPEFDPAVSEYLQHRHYEGNIRELRQLVQRIAHRHPGRGFITVGDIPEEDRPSEGALPRAWPDGQFERTIAAAIALGAGLREINAETTRAAIRIAVQSEQGNLQRAARRLGVTDRALQMRRAAGTLNE